MFFRKAKRALVLGWDCSLGMVLMSIWGRQAAEIAKPDHREWSRVSLALHTVSLMHEIVLRFSLDALKWIKRCVYVCKCNVFVCVIPLITLHV